MISSTQVISGQFSETRKGYLLLATTQSPATVSQSLGAFTGSFYPQSLKLPQAPKSGYNLSCRTNAGSSCSEYGIPFFGAWHLCYSMESGKGEKMNFFPEILLQLSGVILICTWSVICKSLKIWGVGCSPGKCIPLLRQHREVPTLSGTLSHILNGTYPQKGVSSVVQKWFVGTMCGA